MKNLLPLGTLGLAGAVGIGLIALPGGTPVTAGIQDDAVVKREDQVTDLVPSTMMMTTTATTPVTPAASPDTAGPPTTTPAATSPG